MEKITHAPKGAKQKQGQRDWKSSAIRQNINFLPKQGNNIWIHFNLMLKKMVNEHFLKNWEAFEYVVLI